MWTDPENVTIAHRNMNVEVKTEVVAQFLFWEYIKGIFVAVHELLYSGSTLVCVSID
jgi:hypothetical protein